MHPTSWKHVIFDGTTSQRYHSIGYTIVHIMSQDIAGYEEDTHNTNEINLHERPFTARQSRLFVWSRMTNDDGIAAWKRSPLS
jgi:hypothetical protein